MKTLTIKDLDKDQRRKVIGAYGMLAYEKVYKLDGSGILRTAAVNKAGVVRMVGIGEDPEVMG